ncbi:MAG: L-histidine N(alpha)-methyltransferase [Fimbriimonadaceae bacterium]|nr:L-histidine N(alpha)-methyltransferase [Fimbriimonadaceae bacterium]QYK56831.1 MAG: L-histidine N(alpha)-methyltransferase [Fimbriimonadaceae bacterium]
MPRTTRPDGVCADVRERLSFFEVAPNRPGVTLVGAVRDGLLAPRKKLPSHLLYDEEGSRLFDLITELPEYYLTRCERAILEKYAPEIVAGLGQEIDLVEFGCGSGAKTRAMLRATTETQGTTRYIPIDISGEHMRASALAWLAEFPKLEVHALAAEYRDGLDAVPDGDRARLFLFMGSNIGNLELEEATSFLNDVRRRMKDADGLLIGFDLVKDPRALIAAYNDARGVTARFTKNLLVRINAELGADFDLAHFEHDAQWEAEKERMTMHIVCTRRQCVRIEALDLFVPFEEGEKIWTEISQKYTLDSMRSLLSSAGFELGHVWHDPDQYFAVGLARPVGKDTLR